MRSLDPAFAAHVAGEATTLCHCWRVLRRDGVAMGFTDHDLDLNVAGFVYAARTGLEAASAETSLGFAVGGSEISGALSADALNEADLANGAYDGASVEAWLVNWADPSQRLLLEVSTIGQVKRSEYAFTAELRTLAHEFDQERGRLYQAVCSADLGDGRCRAALSAPAFVLSATVVGGDGAATFTADISAYASGWFTGGAIVFTSGANQGARAGVKRQSGDSIFLWEPLALPLAAGDAFTLTAGCDKSFATCGAKFANQDNYRGFPHIPGNDHILAYPTQGDSALDGGSLQH